MSSGPEKPGDLGLPLAVISRIINEAIPTTIVTAEVRKVLCKTASVFILYTTATAGAIATKHGRKTISANDVIEAVDDMDFTLFVVPLKRSLEEYRQLQQKKKESTASRKMDETSKTSSSIPSTSAATSSGRSSSTASSSKKKLPPIRRGQQPPRDTEDDVVTLSSDSD